MIVKSHLVYAMHEINMPVVFLFLEWLIEWFNARLMIILCRVMCADTYLVYTEY